MTEKQQRYFEQQDRGVSSAKNETPVKSSSPGGCYAQIAREKHAELQLRMKNEGNPSLATQPHYK